MSVVINEFDVVTDQTKEQQPETDPCAQEEAARQRSPVELRDTLRREWERLWRVRAI